MSRGLEYYYVGDGLKRMQKMSKVELAKRTAAAYQLAGALLIGAKVRDTRNKKKNVNGWTNKEVNLAIETLLDFLWCPAEVSQTKLESAIAISREVS